MHTILIADDSTTIQRAVEIVFDKEPFSVVKAGSGAEAVARARDAKPALVLVDHLMADKTGYEVAEALRADPSTSSIPILMLSHSSAPYDEGRAKAAGVLGHVPKPFDCTTLLERVKNILGVTASGPVAGATPVAATPAAVAATPRPPSVPGFGGGLPRPPATGGGVARPVPTSGAPAVAAASAVPAAVSATPAAISNIPTAARPATPTPARDLDPFGFGKNLSSPPASTPAAVAPTSSSAGTTKPNPNPFGAAPAAGGLSATDERWGSGARAPDVSIDVAMDDFSGAAKPAPAAAKSLSGSEFMEVSDLDVTPSSASAADDGKSTARVDVARLQEMDRIAAATAAANAAAAAAAATAKSANGGVNGGAAGGVGGAVAGAAARVAAEAAPAIAAATGAAPSQAALTAEARAIVEKIAWEVVPELAEAIIRAEIKRLLAK